METGGDEDETEATTQASQVRHLLTRGLPQPEVLLDQMFRTTNSDMNQMYQMQEMHRQQEQPLQLQQQSISGASTWSLLMGELFHYTNATSMGDPINSGLGSSDTSLSTIATITTSGSIESINWPNFLLAVFLILLMLTTSIGNLFVIVAILIERNLRTIGNYLVLSLAIADLLVACLVMPLAGIYQILDRWTLGVILCDLWTSMDVFCCTGEWEVKFEVKI